MTRKRSFFLGAIGIVVITLAVSTFFFFRSLPSGWTWEMVTWRAQIFARKAEGRIPDLSWRELWFMTRTRGGFGMETVFKYGFSVEGAVTNPFQSDEDHQAGTRTFDQRCAVCHGKAGAGGYAPALNHSGLSHGDGDLAIYKVVRDGIPRTGMRGISMSPLERWQVIGYLRALQVANLTRAAEQLSASAIQVTSDQVLKAGSKTDEWLTYSGSIDGRRYTSLSEITPQNVSRLGLRWVRQFETTEPARSESTPLVVDGEIFYTEPPSNVVALDARTGSVRWRYSRTLPDKLPTCCARVNRGLAILGDTLYLGSLDCNLTAINANSGNVVWQSRVCDTAGGYTITGAPLIVKDSVLIGVAGGEFGVRGFLAAFDARTGQQKWKFDTIPGPGELGHDSWKNDAWRSGGGPTWLTGSYDPSLDLVYWGVGNPTPGFQGDARPGDNLFTDSEIALHAGTGTLAWYFQFTPHDEHDWDSVQTPILADLKINGAPRRVLCTANRNGFYYVLDRATGEFLLGVPFVSENWATGLDSHGRPILTSNAVVSSAGRLTKPGVAGGINWQNSAFDPRSGVVFIPATEEASVFTKSAVPQHGEMGFYPGSAGSSDIEPDPVVRAVDAATGQMKWEYFSPAWKKPFAHGYGGLLATGGGVIFGASEGFVFALDSATGHELWRVYLGADTYAPPISVNIDNHQVILISAGRTLLEFGL
jgi:alcohol dehydrogenase (cytochrome c)